MQISTLRKIECEWFNDINDLDGDGDSDAGPLIFQCPKNHYMAEVRSIFEESVQDRL